MASSPTTGCASWASTPPTGSYPILQPSLLGKFASFICKVGTWSYFLSECVDFCGLWIGLVTLCLYPIFWAGKIIKERKHNYKFYFSCKNLNYTREIILSEVPYTGEKILTPQPYLLIWTHVSIMQSSLIRVKKKWSFKFFKYQISSTSVLISKLKPFLKSE